MNCFRNFPTIGKPGLSTFQRLELIIWPALICSALLFSVPSVYSDTHYVNVNNPSPASPYTNWADAATVIQDAVDAATAGDTVLCSNGVYDTGGMVTPGYALTNRVCITNAVTVRSVNGPGVTIIAGAEAAGGGCGDDAVRAVFMNNGSMLTGFTITNGYTAADSGYIAFDESGGGIWLTTDCVVSNCTITGNMADNYGGGVYFHEDGTLNHSRIIGNESYDGDGGGVCLNGDGTLNNCILRGNTAWFYGGGICLETNGTLNNCEIRGNTSSDSGGGVYMYGGILNNCTLTENSAANNGGGACLDWGGTLNNCIAWSNTASSYHDIRNNSGLAIRYTCASDGVTHGTDNCITNNPLFVDASNSNFQLQATSPCINTGDNTYAPTNASPYDLAGNPRIVFGTVDMGAYEVQYMLSANNGPYAGGNSITITNGTLGDGGDITNVTVGGIAATILDQGSNWVSFIIPGADSAGAKDIVIESTSVGETTFVDAYTYNPAGRIVKWAYGPDVWTNLGSGIKGSNVQALDYDGSHLYVGGYFTNAGGVTASCIAQYDPATGLWTNLGDGVNSSVMSITHDGTNLYVGGGFWTAGGNTAYRIAKWDGAAWTNLSTGISSMSFWVSALAHDGTNLIAGGNFTNIGGQAINRIAQWDPVAEEWSPLAGGVNGAVRALLLKDDRLYAAGDFTAADGTGVQYVAEWVGDHWYDLDGGMSHVVYGLAHDGSDLYAAGSFEWTGPIYTRRVARWNGASWTNLGSGLNTIASAALWENDALYVGGYFTDAGGSTANRAAKWNGSSWTNLGSGLNERVYTLAHDGTYLYAGGLFTNAGGVAASRIAKWGPSYIRDTSVAPMSGSWTGGYPVVIIGSNLCNGSDVTNVTLCGVSVDSIDSQSATQIVVTAGQASVAGIGDVRIFSTSYGESIKSNAFTYLREDQEALVFTPTSPQTYLTTNALSVSGGSGTGAVSYAVLSGPGMIVDDTNLTVIAGTGTIEIRATKAQDDRYFEAAVTGTVEAAKATASVYLADLTQTYDGTAKSVTATTDPSGLTVEFTYDGNAWAPTNAGTYAVTGTINDVNYMGSATDTLTIDKANQAISGFLPTNGSIFAWTDTAGLSAAGGASDNPVTFAVAGGPGQISGATNLGFTGVGAVQVTADQAGDANWNAAPTVTNTFNVLGPQMTVLGTNGAAITSGEAPDSARGSEFETVMWHYPAPTNIFTISNPGTSELRIDGITTNGSEYFRIVSWPATVATQSAGNLAIALDTTEDGTYTARVEIAFNGTNSPFVLNLEGDVEPDMMSIWLPTQIVEGVERNIFSRDTWEVLQALTDLRDIINATNLTNIITRFGGWPGYNPAFTNGDTARLEGDLDYLLDVFPQSAATFTNVVAVGEKSYIDQYGDYFTTDNPEIFDPLPYTNTYTLTLEAGRHTAAAGIAQVLENVELVTRWNRIQILASDNTQTQGIDFAALPAQVVTNSVGLGATASSGLPVSFAVGSGPGTIEDDTNLSFSAHGMVEVVASQTGSVNYLSAPDITNGFRVYGLFTVTVYSAWGTAVPPTGDYVHVEETVITNRIGTPDLHGTTQYVCGGWSMTGNNPVSGMGTNCIMTVTNDAALTWQWTTNYWLAVSATTNGSVDAASGWYGFGTLLMINATASNYYHFDQWTVTPGGADTNNPLNLTIDQPYGLLAAFAENRTTNTGTPEWWLAEYGLTNFEADAEGDNDNDGIPTWREYIADTIPTNANSLLEIDGIGMGPGSRRIEWIGGTGVVQYLEWTTNAGDGSVWVIISTNSPPTPVTNQVDLFEDWLEGYYRIRAVR